MAKRDSLTVARISASNLGRQVAAGWGAAGGCGATLGATENILVCGMGGSALGADIVAGALGAKLRKPVAVERSYRIPGWVGKRTAVICISYSGNTAETVSCYRMSVSRGAQVVAVATGGKLLALARARRTPLVEISDAALNPSRQPRLGLGFSVGALLRLLDGAGAVAGGSGAVARVAARRGVMPTAAAVLALSGKVVAVVGVQEFLGAAHAVANCINENAKAFAAPFGLPELDHHLLEGLSFPVGLRRSLGFLVFAPAAMPRALANQYRATLQILKRKRIVTVERRCPGEPLAATLSAVSWGTQLSIQLAASTGTEPLAVPWVKWLKEQQRG